MHTTVASTAARILQSALLATVLTPIVSPSLARAATITVSSTQGTDTPACGGSSPCKTIKYALVNRAANDDTINVHAGTYSEKLDVSKSVTITAVPGPPPVAIPAMAVINGIGTSRVFTIRSGVKISISNVIIQNARSTGEGAAIANLGTLSLKTSTIRNNALGKFGHDHCYPCVGAGISNRGTMTMTNVTVRGNTATAGTGGGPFTGVWTTLNQGGGVYNAGDLTVSESTIANNTALGGGGGIYNTGKVSVTRSTVSGNSGSGIVNTARLSADNSTISGNKPIGIADASCNAQTTLDYVTVALNDTGIYNVTGTGGELVCTEHDSWLKARGSIIANSTAGANCTGTILSEDYNLDSQHSCGFQRPHDLSNANPGLGPLTASSGPAGPVAGVQGTATHALLPGSAAIDAGGTTTNGCPTTDQRGVTRPQRNACDIGAFEVQ